MVLFYFDITFLNFGLNFGFGVLGTYFSSISSIFISAAGFFVYFGNVKFIVLKLIIIRIKTFKDQPD